MSLFGNLFGKKEEQAAPVAAPQPIATGNELTFDLTKGPVSLNPFDAVNLTKSDDTLTDINLAAGWDPINGIGKNIDLDLSIHMFDANGRHDETVYFGNLSTDGVKHSGDNLTGAGEGDDEVIRIDLSALDPSVTRLEVTVTSFTKVRFRNISNAFVRLVDNRSNREVARFDLTEHGGDNTAVRFGQFIKENGEWKFKALGIYSKDTIRSFNQNL